MSKVVKAAVALSVLATPAFAANMENPLYLPKSGEVYSKTGLGLMYKKADNTVAMQKKGHGDASEFPIIRAQEDLGVGITDRLNVFGSFGWTQDDDINRKGMHLGRVGLAYRIFEGAQFSDGIVWDIYGGAHLGGVSKMTGEFDLGVGAFNYDNYSNGRWGAFAGTKIGKTWDKFTAAVFVEGLQTFGNSNNEITMLHPALGEAAKISVDLKSTLEVDAGLKAFYEIDSEWSVGGGFTYKHHHDNGVKSLSSMEVLNPLAAGALAAMTPTLLAQMADMQDGFDEYILSLSVAKKLTDATQVALYGDYTFDTSHPNSQNGTDVKFEVGARINLAF